MTKQSRFFGAVGIAVVASLFFSGLAEGQSFGDRLTINGFISQAYGGASDYPIYGLTTEGTGDYRAVALQARFAITSSDFIVAQVNHRALGNSVLAALDEEVELAWAFYQKRIWGNSIRVGRVPMPRGIFNEIRNVGTILPFYRASKAFYSEGVETVDGVSIGRSFDLPLGFGFDAYAYGGSFDLRVEVVTQSGLQAVEEPVEDVYGSQLWLNTPITGARVGGGYIVSKMKNSGSDQDDFDMWTVSAEAVRDRYFVRGEYLKATQQNTIEYVGYYGQAGVNLWKGLWANAQAEWNTNLVLDIPIPGGLEIDAITDYAYGLSYKVSPKLVIKGEYHQFEGYQVDVPVDFMGDPVSNNFFMISVAAAF
jgi:hypothetical protein